MHHSSSGLSDEARWIQQKRDARVRGEDLGATGRFPGGKLDESDEGELAFEVVAYQGKVVINFNKSVHWLGMDAEQARLLARSLMSRATQVEKERKPRRR